MTSARITRATACSIFAVFSISCGATSSAPLENVLEVSQGGASELQENVLEVPPGVAADAGENVLEVSTPERESRENVLEVSGGAGIGAANLFGQDVADMIIAIVERRPGRRADAFIKVGDSATVNRAFLRCLSDERTTELDGREELSSVLARFRSARIGRRDPFSRESLAAGVGWSVPRVLRGSPAPVVREVRQVNPRFALIMFGSNDIELGRLGRYESRMRALTERLISLGVVPVLSTIPPRNDEADADERVPDYNAVIRAIAEERHLPLIDLYGALMPLPNRGLASDGLHPSAPVRDGRAQGCDFTESGLQFGQNVRNLLTLEMLFALSAVLDQHAS